MKYFELAEIILTETDENSLLYLSTDVTPNLLSNWRGKAQRMYILSNDKIEEGDWCYDKRPDEEGILHDCVYQIQDIATELRTSTEKKIIATYPSLIIPVKTMTTPEGVTIAIHVRNFSQPTQEFIEYFIEEYNKGNVIEDALVEYEEYLTNGWVPTYYNPDNHNLDEPAEMDYRVKINPENNTITIKIEL